MLNDSEKLFETILFGSTPNSYSPPRKYIRLQKYVKYWEQRQEPNIFFVFIEIFKGGGIFLTFFLTKRSLLQGCIYRGSAVGFYLPAKQIISYRTIFYRLSDLFRRSTVRLGTGYRSCGILHDNKGEWNRQPVSVERKGGAS